MSDEVTITIKLTRNKNGSITQSRNIEGQGFYYYEIIGLLQMACLHYAQESEKVAQEMSDKYKHPTKLKFENLPTGDTIETTKKTKKKK